MENKLFIWDFDGTLCYTPTPDVGIPHWQEKTGKYWYDHHTGWWSAAESLNMEVFHISMNMWIYNEYLKAVNEGAMNHLVTGRLEPLKQHVSAVCDYHGVKFDDIHCCDGRDTFVFKCHKMEQLIEQYKATEMIMYDDRMKHLDKFVTWGKKYMESHPKVRISIINSVSKKVLL